MERVARVGTGGNTLPGDAIPGVQPAGTGMDGASAARPAGAGSVAAHDDTGRARPGPAPTRRRGSAVPQDGNKAMITLSALTLDQRPVGNSSPGPAPGTISLSGFSRDRTIFDSGAGVNLPPQARRVAYLFQDYALFPHLTVRQNVGFVLARGWLNPRSGEIHEAVDYWLAAFNLQDVAHQFPVELSGGQRQRTALARALVARPRALLLDEPFAALDPALRQRMRVELDELQTRLGVPMIIITHDPEDVAAFGEQVLCMNEGQVVPQAQGLLSVGLAA